ncbi:hypothetical protein F5148DRAFT_215891 [Russula earlei]|uniref:Uncharacterized protein n=1 Tax=Russula earlei TaxID=71964 RepID=A0ACC0U482_9AGAM|nr:hypothetical protein F5148DRAFT_215891 [Russula earlei]
MGAGRSIRPARRVGSWVRLWSGICRIQNPSVRRTPYNSTRTAHHNRTYEERSWSGRWRIPPQVIRAITLCAVPEPSLSMKRYASMPTAMEVPAARRVKGLGEKQRTRTNSDFSSCASQRRRHCPSRSLTRRCDLKAGQRILPYEPPSTLANGLPPTMYRPCSRQRADSTACSRNFLSH